MGLLAIAGVGMMEAKVVKITIPLVMPQYADQATDEGVFEHGDAGPLTLLVVVRLIAENGHRAVDLLDGH